MLITITVDYDENALAWVLTERDEDNMPLDQRGEYKTEREARRAASQLRYALKTRRAVVRR